MTSAARDSRARKSSPSPSARHEGRSRRPEITWASPSQSRGRTHLTSRHRNAGRSGSGLAGWANAALPGLSWQERPSRSSAAQQPGRRSFSSRRDRLEVERAKESIPREESVETTETDPQCHTRFRKAAPEARPHQARVGERHRVVGHSQFRYMFILRLFPVHMVKLSNSLAEPPKT